MSISLDKVRDRVRDKLNESVISTPEIDKAILGADRSQLEAVHGESTNSNSQILLTLPSIPDGAKNWAAYPARYSTSFGLYPSTPSSPDIFPPYLSNPHPWLTDLRAMQQMLEGLVEIPHWHKVGGNSHDRKKARRAQERNGMSPCEVCTTALKRRREYQKAKLLSKET